MTETERLKIEIFDILEQQTFLQQKFNELEESKKKKLQQIQNMNEQNKGK